MTRLLFSLAVLLSLAAPVSAETRCEPLPIRDHHPLGFANHIDEMCHKALAEIANPHEPAAAWLAYRFLEELSIFTKRLDAQGHFLSESGAYLIARSSGLLPALARWEASRGHV